MGIGILNFCKQGFEALRQFAETLPVLKPSQPSPYCDEIRTQLHLKTVEQGRSYVQGRLYQAQGAGASGGGAAEKLGNWAKGYSLIDNGAKQSESAEFQKILDCLDTPTKDRLVPAMALKCEIPGMRSGLLCWTNAQTVAESAILASTPLFTRKALNEVALKTGSGLRPLGDHAVRRMMERGITRDTIEEAVQKGLRKPGNVPDSVVFELPSHVSSTGRGARIVVEESTGKVITVIDKGSNYLPR